jgi:hypothetical protein
MNWAQEYQIASSRAEYTGFDIKVNIASLGLSCKTQELYLIVFCVRYLDLFMYFISLYNTFMKLFFISSTAFIIYLMKFKKPFCSVSCWYN